jgi:hypothetical protein
MKDNILSTSGKLFQKFTSHLTEKLSKPKTKFITDLLCGILFASNLILTNIASKVPHPSRLTAVAKRFRRHLTDGQPFIKPLWFSYLKLAGRRLDIDSLFPIDLSDLAKPYAKKMENIALVRDGDKGTLVTGYWCMEYLPNTDKPLYVVAYHTKGYDEPVILLTDMVVENFEQALQIRNRYARRRVGCESSVEFLKSCIGIERFAVRRYQSMQQLVFLAALAMGFLSYLLSRCRRIREIVDDGL